MSKKVKLSKFAFNSPHYYQKLGSINFFHNPIPNRKHIQITIFNV